MIAHEAHEQFRESVTDLIEVIADSGVPLDPTGMERLQELVRVFGTYDYRATFAGRVRRDEKPEYTRYFIKPLQRYSVTISQRWQVSVQAADAEHAEAVARHYGTTYGECFDERFEDIFPTDG